MAIILTTSVSYLRNLLNNRLHCDSNIKSNNNLFCMNLDVGGQRGIGSENNGVSPDSVVLFYGGPGVVVQ